MDTQIKKPRRERPKPVKLTEAAAARLQEIMANADGKYLGLRVGVTNGGCAGMSYTMAYAEDTKPFEEVMEDKGVKIFIDPKAILFLIGTELDFVRRSQRAVHLQQSEPGFGLRLRRERADHAGARTLGFIVIPGRRRQLREGMGTRCSAPAGFHAWVPFPHRRCRAARRNDNGLNALFSAKFGLALPETRPGLRRNRPSCPRAAGPALRAPAASWPSLSQNSCARRQGGGAAGRNPASALASSIKARRPPPG
jgi:iron-sulfur cluster assembly protein